MDYSQYYIQEFKKYISLQTTSVNTIKNYLSDLRIFLSYIVQTHHQVVAPQTLPQFISPDFISQYENYLTQGTPLATAKRRVSSLKKFFDYCATQNIFSLPSVVPNPSRDEGGPPIPPPPPAPLPAPPPPSPFVVPNPPRDEVGPPVHTDSSYGASPSHLVHLLEDLNSAPPPIAPPLAPIPTTTFSWTPVFLSLLSLAAGFCFSLFVSLFVLR
jgi:hypothetical protein